MKNLLVWPFLFCFLACSEPGGKPSTFQREAVETALERADTMPMSEVAALARALPGAMEQDSFFDSFLSLTLQKRGVTALAEATDMYEKIRGGAPNPKITIYNNRGLINQLATNFDSAEYWYGRAIGQCEKLGNREMLAHVLNASAGNLGVQGKLEASIAQRYRALETLQTLAETPGLAPAEKERAEYGMFECRAFLANNFNQKLEHDKALEVAAPALEYFTARHDTAMTTYCLTVSFSAYEKKGELDRAFDACRKALNLQRAAKLYPRMADNLNNYAKLLQRQEKWQEALDTLQVARTLYQESNNKQGLLICNMNIGRSQLRLNRLPEAEQNLQFAFDESQKRVQFPLALNSSRELAELHKRRGDFRAALGFQEKMFAFRDSIFTKEKEKVARELTVKYETREKEGEIAALKREKKLAEQRNIWVGGLGVLLAGLGFWFVRFRSRKQQTILEKQLAAEHFENEAHAARQAFQAQKMEQSERELSLFRQQLDDFARHLQEKNQQISALQTGLNATSQSTDDEIQQPTAAHAAEEDRELLFQQSLFANSDWETFKTYFERVYPGLIAKLKIHQPDLSPAELRVLLLVKMNLRDREMASTLGVSPDSVKKLRYRLRRKTGLDEVELLESLK